MWSNLISPLALSLSLSLSCNLSGFFFVPSLSQILALCHVAVGQQLNLHWLHKVRVTVPTGLHLHPMTSLPGTVQPN